MLWSEECCICICITEEEEEGEEEGDVDHGDCGPLQAQPRWSLNYSTFLPSKIAAVSL